MAQERWGCGKTMKAITAVTVALAVMFPIACVEVDQDNVVKDQTVARLSHLLAQQDSNQDAFRAFRLLVQVGEIGTDAHHGA